MYEAHLRSLLSPLAPAADLAAEDGTLPMLGRVTVTEMEADDDV